MKNSVVFVLLSTLCAQGTQGLSFLAGDAHSFLLGSSSSVVDLQHVLGQYKESLVTNPLETKMVTGATLAVMGDAIAQSRNDDDPYDAKRAASFGVFDASYRVVQHVSFPAIVSQCQGQYIGSALSIIPFVAQWISSSASNGVGPTYYFATMEQTLASQLIIVPFIYYPIFFTITTIVQGLTAEAGLERAKETFIPLMKRNLLFWIPVQFVQFSFVEEGLQIPFLSVCGLAWTFILSIMAGSTKSYVQSHDENDYCVIGIEAGCEITDEHLFPEVELAQQELNEALMQAMEKEQGEQLQKQKETTTSGAKR